jgi:hypothetical protein
MAANYRAVNARSSHPLAFVVVNSGSIREFLTELSANAEMLWNFKAFDTDAFLRRYCARYFGAGQAESVAALYHDYYYAYWTQKPADLPGFDRQYIFQDQRYSRAAEWILRALKKPERGPTPLGGRLPSRPDLDAEGIFRIDPPAGMDQIGALLLGTKESGEKFASVAARADRLLPLIDPKGRAFFKDNLRMPARVMAHLNAMLHELTLAYQSGGDRDETYRHLLAAHDAITAAQADLAESDHDLFTGWHQSDHFFRVSELKENIAATAADFARSSKTPAK